MRGGEVLRQMPLYQSHKKVWALKIKSITIDVDGSAVIEPADEGFSPFEVSSKYVDKHKPEAGGYYIQYKDGYESWSPAKAFEEGYTLIS